MAFYTHSPIHTHSHPMAVPLPNTSNQEQCGVQYLAQGHLVTWVGRAGTKPDIRDQRLTVLPLHPVCLHWWRMEKVPSSNQDLVNLTDRVYWWLKYSCQKSEVVNGVCVCRSVCVCTRRKQMCVYVLFWGPEKPFCKRAKTFSQQDMTLTQV